jgi:D-alanyl-D-alanine carboxypeptidase (penicillin-binding protein 5/6)
MNRLRQAVLFLTLLVLIPASSPRAEILERYSSAKQACLMDFETGMVLFEKNADQKMPTSSMSKVMTVFMVFEALKDGRITLDSELPVSEKAWRKGGSKMFVEVGDHVRVEDLIRGVLAQSGNDATIVLAEGLAGSEQAFAEAMTARAKSLGMMNSRFMNASGWPDKNHYSSARDLCILARTVIREFPEYFPYFSLPEFTYSGIKQRNRNPLLYRDMGADGMKTGYTAAGGYGLIGTGEWNGRRAILVVNGMGSGKERAQEGARLLEWGMRGFHNVNVFATGETVTDAPVVLGKQDTIPLTTAEDIRITVPTAKAEQAVMEAVFDSPLKAPVERGQTVGVLRINIPGMAVMETPLIAAQDVKTPGLFSGTLAKAGLILGGGQAHAGE